MAPPPPTRYDDLAVWSVGISFVYYCHCEEGKARRGNPFSFRPRRERAMLCIAGDADCHAPYGARNDTVFQPVLLTCTEQSTNRVGGGNAARPTMEY